MCDSQRADAKLTQKEWRSFGNEKLHPAFSRRNMKAQHVYKQQKDYKKFPFSES